jgi:hypothetical protein
MKWYSFTTALIAFLFAQPARSQAGPEALFGRLMTARLDTLAREPAIAALAPGKHGLALMQASSDSALYFMDDEGLRTLSGLFAESAARATPEACAQLYTGGGDAFPEAFSRVMQSADSVLLDRWSSFMIRVVRVGILRPAPGRLASSDEVGAVLRKLVMEQPAADRERLRRGAAKVGSAEDICLFTKTLYAQLAALPASIGGPVFRAMMNGVRPKL